MNSAAAVPLRLVAFGDLEGSVWGAAVAAPEPAIVFGADAASESMAGRTQVQFVAEHDSWHLRGDGFDLVVSPQAPAEAAAGAGTDQLCTVTGTITVAGATRAIECLGTRSVDTGFEPAGLDSLRSVASWFAPDRGLTLRALRPRRARGQEADRMAATLLDPDGPVAVDDPRLSTTYGAGERPARTSLELWITVGEDQYPRRAAGEALGTGGAAHTDGLTLEVTPLRCHANGLDGAGVYLLARFPVSGH
ncbi:MAG TPA: hypothetical protein VII87_11030 [Solirubrobacteraceae bacterium]